MFLITSDFMDDFNKKPIREIISYHHKLQYQTDEEVISIEVDNLPPGLFFHNNVISGNMKELNSWHEIKDYLKEEIKNRCDDEIYSFDVYETWESEDLATIKYLKDHRFEMHYTGITEFLFGAKAYILDKMTPIPHNVIFRIKTQRNNYSIERTLPLAPLFSNKRFIISYGRKHKLYDENKKFLSPSEFIMWRKKQGGIFY